jgi:t-SNARE complex subunit (syntaxin)
VTTDQKIEQVLAFLGALVPLMSAIASWINHRVRTAQEQGREVSSLALQAGAALNVGALNLDKAVQLAKAARKKKP